MLLLRPFNCFIPVIPSKEGIHNEFDWIPDREAAWCRLGADVRFWAEERCIGNGFRVALRLPGMTEGENAGNDGGGGHAGVNESPAGCKSCQGQ